MEEHAQLIEQQDLYDARVIRDHVATHEFELNLRIGEEVHVMEDDASGWAGGYKVGGDEEVIGWFPKYCLERLQTRPHLHEVRATPAQHDGGQAAAGGGRESQTAGATGGVAELSCSADLPDSAQEAQLESPVRDIRAVATPQGHSPQRLQQQQQQVIQHLQQQLQVLEQQLRQQVAASAEERQRLGDELSATQLAMMRTELHRERDLTRQEEQQRSALERLGMAEAEAARRSEALEARLHGAEAARRSEEERRVTMESMVEELRAENLRLQGADAARRSEEVRRMTAESMVEELRAEVLLLRGSERAAQEEVEALQGELVRKEAQAEAADRQRRRLVLELEEARAKARGPEPRPRSSGAPPLHSVHGTSPICQRPEPWTPEARAPSTPTAAAPAPAPPGRPRALAPPPTTPADPPRARPTASPMMGSPMPTTVALWRTVEASPPADEARLHQPDPAEAPRAGSVRAQVRQLEQRAEAVRRQSSRGPCPLRSGAAGVRASAPPAPWQSARASTASLSVSVQLDDDEARPYCESHMGMMPLQRDATAIAATGDGGSVARFA